MAARGNRGVTKSNLNSVENTKDSLGFEDARKQFS